MLSLKKTRVSDLEIQVDNNEQHNRNYNLLLHGVPEKNGENTTKELVEALAPYNVIVSEVDVARSHRLGPRQRGNKPRPIIARFCDEMKKIEIYRKKSSLKIKGR